MDQQQTDSEIEFEENGDFTVTFSMALPTPPAGTTNPEDDNR